MATLNDVIEYNLHGTRQLPLSNELSSSISQALSPLGLSFQVFSGGQNSADEIEEMRRQGREDLPGRVGGPRHDHGNAADGYFVMDGRRLDPANDEQDREVVANALQYLSGYGVHGVGHGPGYMDKTHPGAFHIGFGSKAVWGASTKGDTAQDWVEAAVHNPRIHDDSPAPAQTDEEIAAMADAAMSKHDTLMDRAKGKPSEGGVKREPTRASRNVAPPGWKMFGGSGGPFSGGGVNYEPVKRPQTRSRASAPAPVAPIDMRAPTASVNAPVVAGPIMEGPVNPAPSRRQAIPVTQSNSSLSRQG